MFTEEEAASVATLKGAASGEERVQAYVDALQVERKGLEGRLTRLKDGRPDPVNATEKVLQGRLKDVDAELERVAGAKKTSSAGKKKAAEEQVSEEA